MSNLHERIRKALEDRYLILDEIGQGAAAVVFLAEDRKHHRQVAIKVLRPEVAADVGAERFIREIETVAQLSHPHILVLFDSGEADGLPYFVMPYVPGESLRDRLAREHQLPVDEALDYARDVAGALSYAHSLGIVHRDIKPGNILLSAGRAIVADFGVARAISAAIEGEGERPGELFGTPLYMSPEQFTGSGRIDRRSDLYSLGCVLYEMIAGAPPFTGPTAEALAVQHNTEAPPSLRHSQRNVPGEVIEVVDRLLAKAPADRFITAQQLVDTLPVGGRRVSGRERVVSGSRWRRWGGLAAASVALIAIVSALAARANPEPDPGLYTVLSTEGMLAGQDSRLVSAVRAELERWDDADMRVAPELAVVDQVRKQGAPEDLDALTALARRVRAGQLLRVETRATHAGVHVALALYQTVPMTSGAAPQSESVSCAAADAACDSALTLATRRLVVSGGRSLPDGYDPGTNRLAAYRALVDGLHDYAEWDLPQAERRLFDAARFDPGFSDAHLNLAEVRWWLGRPALEWRNEAAAALARAPTGGRAAFRARGLVALADRRFPEACQQFDSLIARNPGDFSAWYGRGECLRKDGVVVPDRTSRSGWRFRSSRNAALASYERALTLAPGIHRGFGANAYQRTARLFPVNEYELRPGYLEKDGKAQDSVAFAAWPDLVGDSLTFVPWPFRDVTTGVERTRAANQFRAILRNRSRVAEITDAWVRSFPESPVAHLARAEALESLREGGQEAGWREVLHHADEARRLSGGDKVLHLAALGTAVRLELKAERYAEAAALADSALLAPVPADTASARLLASVAALVGRIERAVQLTAEGARDFERISLDGQRFVFPTPLSEAALALLTYAAFGGPTDSVAALERRVEELTIGFVPPDRQLAARTTLLARPAALAFPTMGMRPAHRTVDPRYEGLALQRLQADGQRDELRRRLHAEEKRFGWRPSSTNVDAVFLAAVQFLAVGDTAEAIRWSNASLTSLAGYGRDLLSSELEGALPQVATLPRLMALRADLAALDRDTETARRWAGAVVILWAGADPALQPIVTRMRALLEQ